MIQFEDYFFFPESILKFHFWLANWLIQKYFTKSKSSAAAFQLCYYSEIRLSPCSGFHMLKSTKLGYLHPYAVS